MSHLCIRFDDDIELQGVAKSGIVHGFAEKNQLNLFLKSYFVKSSTWLKFLLLPGAVDEKSPAAAAGLKKGDIIIEINGVNVTRENHGQLVARIKNSGNMAVFLVADKECWVRYLFLISDNNGRYYYQDYYHRQNLVISSSLSNVIRLSSERSELSSGQV